MSIIFCIFALWKKYIFIVLKTQKKILDILVKQLILNEDYILILQKQKEVKQIDIFIIGLKVY